MSKVINLVLIMSSCLCSIMACQNKDHAEIRNYKFYNPLYDNMELVVSTDTLHLPLNKTNNSVESIGLFSDCGIEYVAIYNRASETINIYELSLQKLMKTISLRGYLLHKRHKTSVYCKNFDSIFISNNTNSLFIIDSSGAKKRTVYFPENLRSIAADFKNSRPPVLKDSCFFASFPTTDMMVTISKVKDWQLMCRLDLKNKKKVSLYRMPERYMNKLYGFYFLNYSFCFNNRRNFVFSFPADSTLCETDFADINWVFLGRSQFQQGDIKPVNKYKKGDEAYFEYLERDCYGAVFFDPFHKRYLRIFKHRISEKDLAAKKFRRDISVVIFNEGLQIIGESLLPKGVLINSLFFTSDGRMYARTRPKDTVALHFVRLLYKENVSNSFSLSK